MKTITGASSHGKLVALAIASVATACAFGGAGVASAHTPHLPAAQPTPSISSLSVTGYPLPATPTITVTGSDFGGRPSGGKSPARLANCDGTGTGLDYLNSQLNLIDASRSGGLYGAFEEGARFNNTVGNCGGVIISSWTPTQVSFTLGSRYVTDGTIAGGHALESGDTVCVSIKDVPACLQLP